MTKPLPPRTSRVFASHFPSLCRVCGERYQKGDPIAGIGDFGAHLFAHEACTAPKAPYAPPVPQPEKPRRRPRLTVIDGGAAPAAEVEVNVAPPAGPWRN